MTSLTPACPVRPSRSVAACVLSLIATGSLAQQPFDLYTRDGLVTLRANNAPVIQLADALAQELNISVVVSGDEAASLSADIVDEPVDKALAMLTPNYMLVRENGSPGARIIEVVLMLDEAGASSTSVGEFLPSGDPADAIVSEEQAIQDTGSEGGSIAENVEQGIEELRDSMRELQTQQDPQLDPNASSAIGGAVRLDPPPSGFDPANEQEPPVNDQ